MEKIFTTFSLEEADREFIEQYGDRTLKVNSDTPHYTVSVQQPKTNPITPGSNTELWTSLALFKELDPAMKFTKIIERGAITPVEGNKNEISTCLLFRDYQKAIADGIPETEIQDVMSGRLFSWKVKTLLGWDALGC